MARYRVVDFTPDHVDEAAAMLAERHRAHRHAVPALDPIYEDPAVVGAEVRALIGRDDATGAMVYTGGTAVAYVIGSVREDSRWGPNIWVEDAASAATDPEGLREAYAAAAGEWVARGRNSHYVNIPATDGLLRDAWFSLSFGLQHVHALRESVSRDFAPRLRDGLTVRRMEASDIRAVAELGAVLPTHVAQSPVFSNVPMTTIEEDMADSEETLKDPRFAVFVALHEGRVVGTSIATSIHESNGNTKLMRPARAGFLGHAAVSPEARGLGAGRALGEAILAWARDEGYEWVAADWRSTNLEANRTWSALGFRPSFLRLHRLIG